MLANIPITLISAQLPNGNLARLCDVCVFKGSKFMVMANGSTLSLFVSSIKKKGSHVDMDHYILHQILENRFSSSPITAVCWIKHPSTNCSDRGELIVAFDSVLTIYAPKSVLTVSKDFKSYKVDELIFIHF